jgi:phage terminase small subunit
MMTARKRRFIDAYLKCGVATAAAEAAGYSKKTAYSQGGRLLKDVEVCAALSKRTEKAAMSADEVLTELAEIARNGDRDSDRVAALGLLGKHHKLFTDKIEHSGPLLEEMLLAAERRRRERMNAQLGPDVAAGPETPIEGELA